MKQRGAGITILSFFVAAVYGSCIFQNDPAEPNSRPVLQSYFPQWTHKTMLMPDSCWFGIEAIDRDGDLLSYRFYAGDSVIGTTDSVMFYAVVLGEYTIEGRASDGSDYVSRTWEVTVSEKPNEPPVIDWWYPEQEHVGCVIGESTEFRFSVEDNDPDACTYAFLVDSQEIVSAHPDLVYRFLENGGHLVRGVVWDGEFGDTVTWHVNVTGDPDTIAPAAITDLAGETCIELATIRLTWTAPGDDGMSGTAAEYVLRTSAYPIVTEEEWEAAEERNGEPVPSPSGTEEVMIVDNLPPASYKYVVVRAADDFANLSPLGNCVRVFVRGPGVDGYVIDFWSGGPVAEVRVASSGVSCVTDERGYFWLQSSWCISSIEARDELIYYSIGAYYDCLTVVASGGINVRLNLYIMRHLDLVNVVDPDPYQGNFLGFFKDITKTDGWAGRPTVHKAWNHYPITVYNPPKVYGDIDMQLAARGAMDEWEAQSGLDLFAEVGTQAGSDVEIVYVDTLVDKHQVATPACNEDGTPAKKVLWIFSGYTGVPISRFSHLIFAHEFGHVLCLDHSRNTGHLMLGLTMPQEHHVTEDEANAVRIIYHAPPVYDYGAILNE
jgi:hypothetical protein